MSSRPFSRQAVRSQVARRLPPRARKAVRAGAHTWQRARAARSAAKAAWRIGHPDRLVASPVFVLSSVRSGSTLLRVVLNSHSEIVAPHEMHLRTLRVSMERPYSELAMKQLGLNVAKLEHLLWDRVLHRELVRSDKSIIVDKTPGNAAVWPRLAEAWPDAKWIFLLRHPGAIVTSLANARPETPIEEHVKLISNYVRQIDNARQTLPGLTVRYEDLAADPQTVVPRLCRFLGVRYESRMLDYGDAARHGPFRGGIGDWSGKIKSGRIQPPTPPPAEDTMRKDVLGLARTWGYARQE